MRGKGTSKGLAWNLSVWISIIIGLSSLVIVTADLIVNARIGAIRQEIEAELKEQVQINDLSRRSQELISDYRAYLAYGRDEFLDTIYTSREKLMFGLSQVRPQLGGGLEMQQQKQDTLDHINSLWNDFNSLMDKGIEYRQQSDFNRVLLLSQTRTTPTVESLGQLFDQLTNLQEQRINDLLVMNRQLNNWLFMFPFIVLIILAVTGIFLVRYLRNGVIEPIVRLQDAVAQIGKGKYVTLDEMGRQDELGLLYSGIGHMSDQLRERELALESNNRELIAQRDLMEAQNEEIIAQQEEQQETLLKLTEREGELELISSYQERLTGYMELQEFLEHTIPALLRVTGTDAGALVLLRTDLQGEPTHQMVYSSGYPNAQAGQEKLALYGPAQRLYAERESFNRARSLTDWEKGVHGLYEKAFDRYIPLLDNVQQVYGFLLMTAYGVSDLQEDSLRFYHGLIRQFSLALQAQLMNEDRREQARLLEALNNELLSEKQLIQGQRDLIHSMNESVQEGMLMCSKTGEILFANQRILRYFGYTPAEGDTLDEFVASFQSRLDINGDVFCKNLKQMLANDEDVLHERFAVESENGQRHFELYVNPVEDSGSLLVFRDRTEEERSDELKNEFISIVSHELRTPLASVLGFVEILLNRSVSAEKQKKYMETIHNEATRLSNLINDFLDLQRMESGKQSYHGVPVDMCELVGQVAESWQGKNNHAIYVEMPEAPAFILGDRDRITQVLHNLISNAIKYSPNSDQVDIAITNDGQHVQVDVKDYGLGIPEEAKGSIFTKFFRVDNTDRRQIGGTGLGLAIVKEIVEVHQGRIWFERNEGGAGTVFSLQLELHHPTDLCGKVVIIEDDENLAKLVGVAFEKLQLPTVRLSSAEDAVFSLNRSSDGHPLLCIVDIQLKGNQSGWDFIGELVKHPLHAQTPVIVSTVLEQPNHFFETTKEKFLKKPFTIERLLELAQQLLQQSQVAASFVFPYQDEQIIAESFEKSGIHIKEMKVNKDIIEVDIEKHG